jgi:hypothetical protein
MKKGSTPSVPPKTSPGAQNMKTGPNALGTAEHESERAKYENRTRRTRHRRKLVRERKTWKMDPTPSYRWNEFGSAKHENGTRW